MNTTERPRPRLLDAYCCEGGAAVGYHRAGFDVVGVDLFKHERNGKKVGFSQARYPFESHQSDAIEFILKHGHEYDAIHASPPCQAYSIATAGNPVARAGHTRLIAATRDALERTGAVWVIENVEQAASEMRDPITLCGRMFGLGATDEDGAPLVLDRHRLFESSIDLVAPPHPKHGSELVAGVYGGSRRSSKPDATPADDRHAARHERRGGYVPRSRAVRQRLLGIDWMTGGGMQQSIPPVYAEWVGLQLRQHLLSLAAAA